MKKIAAFGLAAVMLLGTLTGCYNSYKLSKFDLDVGDDFTFGKYHDEEIEWEVLSRNFLIDEGKIRVQLYSKYVIDCQPFDEDGETSWADCSLREWLNDDFIKEAFSAKEQKQLAETSYFNIYGDDRFLTDKVYLMSYLRYRMTPEDAMCKATDYAEEQGVATEDGYARYWGRDIIQTVSTSSSDKGFGQFDYPMVFDYDGTMSVADRKLEHLYDAEDIGVRPIICVEFKAPIDKKDIEAGDIVTFGTYDEEPIEWLVADNDKDGITLLSRYGLTEKRMDKKDVDSFEESSLYEWLNDDFYTESFNAKQQKMMVTFDSDNYVTLLSVDEFKECRRAMGFEIYAGYTKAFYDDHPELKDEFPSNQKILDQWWLRDVKSEEDHTFSVYNPTRSFTAAHADEYCSVRPVIKIYI